MITHAHTHVFTHAEALIQSADRETWQTTSIMASELIGKGVEEKEVGVGEQRGGRGGGGEGGGNSSMSLQFPSFFTSHCLQLYTPSVLPVYASAST